ncbi:MAG: hypothetical protein ACI8TQ_001238 [Planctomycetota bacterium]
MTSRSFNSQDPRKKSSPKRATLRKGNKGTADGPNAWDAVESIPASELSDLYSFWASAEDNNQPGDKDELRAQVVEWMGDHTRVDECVAGLGSRLFKIIEHLARAPRFQNSIQELSEAEELAYLGTYDLEAVLIQLSRRALLVETGGSRFSKMGERSFALPVEIGNGIALNRAAASRGVYEVLTLRGYMDRLYAKPDNAKATGSHRVRAMYKLYSLESAAVARIERLPDGVRDLVEKAILEFGGILPRSLFERMQTDLPHWNGRRWQMILEKSLVGTVGRLELNSYGIRHDDETLIVFNEVALAWLRHVAVPGDPDRPHEELALGIDLVSNLSHFLAFILDNDVRFTVHGEIFKTTERKILQHLIPNPGRELSREEVLSFIFRFAHDQGLIDSTGERTIAMTTAGREWGARALNEKLRFLLEYATRESELEGEEFHQLHLRQIFLRLIKRIEPDVWYDLMYLPFLARNTYLANLDDQEAKNHFSDKVQNGTYAPQDDSQRLAWNLVSWVRKRLYLLGLIDIGYDQRARPVAMRLTASGARLFGMSKPRDANAGVGSLVVTPDFEIVLFPTGDDYELMHDLDRFCERGSQGHLLHYSITENSVRRALSEGLALEHLCNVLENCSRTPVPQNVLFSIRDWAISAGLMVLDEECKLRCEDSATWARFKQDPGARVHIAEIVREGEVQLTTRSSPRRLQSLFRELGYFVDLA